MRKRAEQKVTTTVSIRWAITCGGSKTGRTYHCHARVARSCLMTEVIHGPFVIFFVSLFKCWVHTCCGALRF